MRQIMSEIRALTVLDETELYAAAKNLRAPLELVQMVARTGELPVPNFSAGGIATPADAAEFYRQACDFKRTALTRPNVVEPVSFWEIA